MTKLTLSVEEAVVEQAKQIAAANQTSVSAMFSQFVRSAAMAGAGPPKIGPLTRKLSGLITLPPDKSYKELLADALIEKYRVVK